MITLARSLYDQVVEHSHQGGTAEVCGILGGRYDETQSVVRSVHPAENVADRPETRYYIDPEEQLEITERIEAEGNRVVGFYHSHPAGPPHPSQTDAERATWPGRSYVIVALDGYPYVGSWRWDEDAGFVPERITLETA